MRYVPERNRYKSLACVQSTSNIEYSDAFIVPSSDIWSRIFVRVVMDEFLISFKPEFLRFDFMLFSETTLKN